MPPWRSRRRAYATTSNATSTPRVVRQSTSGLACHCGPTVRSVRRGKLRRELQALQPVMCEGQVIETVEQFCYLGWMCTADGSTNMAISTRLGTTAGALFTKMYLVFKDRTLSRDLKLRLYVACIISGLRYCYESWCFNDAAQRRINFRVSSAQTSSNASCQLPTVVTGD